MGQIVPLPSAAGPISGPEKLHDGHVVDGFDSGEPALDNWLVRRALSNQTRGASNTYVVCEHNLVVGYHCLSAGAIALSDGVSAVRSNMPDPIPVMLLGRLAVRRDRAGRGIGSGLLKDAMLRTVQAAEIAGIAALLVHALHERAAEFYLKHDFRRSPTGPLMMMLPLKTIRASLPG